MNNYLKDFIKTYNETFSYDNTLNSFVIQIDEEKIDEILCIYIKRKISRCCISLNGYIYIYIYIPVTKEEVLVKISISNKIFIKYYDKEYIAKLVPNYEEISKNIDLNEAKEKEEKQKKKYIPPKNHPWRNY